MKYCFACKTRTLDDEALYCTECGRRFDAKNGATDGVKVLMRGENVALKKNRPALDKIVVDLQWNCSSEIDIDTAAFLLVSNGKVGTEDDFVFYNNPKHRSECADHTRLRANREQIKIVLSKIPYPIVRIAFSLTINDAEVRRQNFGKVRDIVLRIVDANKNKELIKYTPGNFTLETAIILGEIYLRKSQWKFKAIGEGFEGGLAALCGNFGVEVN